MTEYDDIEGVLSDCRRSQYDEVADVLAYYASRPTNQFGPVYRPFNAPCESTEMAKRLLWAFKAGRALGRSESNG